MKRQNLILLIVFIAYLTLAVSFTHSTSEPPSQDDGDKSTPKKSGNIFMKGLNILFQSMVDYGRIREDQEKPGEDTSPTKTIPKEPPRKESSVRSKQQEEKRTIQEPSSPNSPPSGARRPSKVSPTKSTSSRSLVVKDPIRVQGSEASPRGSSRPNTQISLTKKSVQSPETARSRSFSTPVKPESVSTQNLSPRTPSRSPRVETPIEGFTPKDEDYDDDENSQKFFPGKSPTITAESDLKTITAHDRGAFQKPRSKPQATDGGSPTTSVKSPLPKHRRQNSRVPTSHKSEQDLQGQSSNQDTAPESETRSLPRSSPLTIPRSPPIPNMSQYTSSRGVQHRALAKSPPKDSSQLTTERSKSELEDGEEEDDEDEDGSSEEGEGETEEREKE